MPKLTIQAAIELSPTEAQELSSILECSEDRLEEYLQPFASAALAEVVPMFLGQKVFTRGSDLLEHRLLVLILTAFDGRIPDEQKVSKLFQTTASASRSLIRAVMSKYQYQLRGAIDNSLRALIESATGEAAGGATIAVHSANLVDQLNLELSMMDPTLPPVQKRRASVSTYEIQPSSLRRLRERFGQPPDHETQ
jgi:hypothetical protein